MHSSDLRTQLLVREFRIQGVMRFLEDVRQAARDIRPGFAVPPTSGGQTITAKQVGRGECFYWTEDTFTGKALGAIQSVVLNHDRPI